MSNLADTIQLMIQNAHDDMPHTDMVIGTIATVNPLSVNLNTYAPPITAGFLLLTEAVIEKKIDLHHTHDHAHTHTDPQGGSSGPANPVTTDSGTLYQNPFTNAPLFPDYSTDGASRIVTPALAVGDKVLMLSVSGGQQFIILSRIVEA